MRSYLLIRHGHINGMEESWNQAKRHLSEFNGIPKHNFNLYLKECEWRFNMESPKQQLKDLKNILKEFYSVPAPNFK